MKKCILFLLVLSHVAVFAQRKPKIKGSKNVIEVREELPAFNAIELNDDLDINIQRSGAPGYTITADDNLIDVLKFKVEDSTLVVTSFYKITAKKKLEITINYKDLNQITLREGKLKMKDRILTDELRVDTFGSSKLELNADATITHINMEGNCSGDLNINSDSLNIVLKDRIDVRIYAVSETNTVAMYKNAAVKMDGTTDTLRLNLVGNANFKGAKLEAASAIATLEDSPTARVYAYKDLELDSRGTSKTYAYGPGKITILEFLNSSELHRKEDK